MTTNKTILFAAVVTLMISVAGGGVTDGYAQSSNATSSVPVIILSPMHVLVALIVLP